MSDHTQNIFKAFKDLEFKDTVSHEYLEPSDDER